MHANPGTPLPSARSLRSCTPAHRGLVCLLWSRPPPLLPDSSPALCSVTPLRREGSLGHPSPPHASRRDCWGPRGPGNRTMNSSSCGQCQFRGSVVHYAYTGLLLALGLPLNALALWVFCCRVPRWTTTHVYMVNLATADLCLLCTLPLLLLPGELALLPCHISQGCYLANRYMSISLVMALALDRYVAVRHPLRARGLRSPRRALVLCAALWVLVTGSLALRGLLGVRSNHTCFFGTSERESGTVAFSLLGFYLPLAVLVFCSVQVGVALAQRPATDEGQAETTRRAARMVWANLAVFLACFLPLHLVLSVRLALGPRQHTCAFKCALFITSKFSDANGCLDAICYYYSAKDFQKASRQPAPLSTKAHKSQDSVCLAVTQGPVSRS
ncbi:G-protein coupled receptor 35 [Sorex araneus]|uniref:G-protein coupled receptor 35 n=1 Tax=Sorex araneus TaxID=42254 RepID=UPI002433B6CA|nr:G-protein coupled receptor 35 [Sorex araneus]